MIKLSFSLRASTLIIRRSVQSVSVSDRTNSNRSLKSFCYIQSTENIFSSGKFLIPIPVTETASESIPHSNSTKQRLFRPTFCYFHLLFAKLYRHDLRIPTEVEHILVIKTNFEVTARCGVTNFLLLLRTLPATNYCTK